MKAVVVHEHGDVDKLVFEERPDPEPRPDEVLVRVRATAMNHLDTWVRRGVPGHAYPLPMIPGCDVAGEVVGRGELVADSVADGARVAVSPGLSCMRCPACLSGRDQLCRKYGILGETRDGGYAELVAVPAANLLPMPDGMSFEDAASVPLVFLTAWHMLVDRAALRPGETVLVHAAGSGVGSAAIQIARLWGARVIATAGSDAKLAKARELGADETINYTETDFAKEVKRLTDRRGVEVVFEHTGSATFPGSMKSLAWAGRLVTCGATSGHEATVDLRAVFFKSISILGSTMGSKGEMHEIWKHVGAGRLRPVIDRVMPLEQVREAHRHMAERAQFGKIVLTP